jgi:hypothetical protein
MKRRLNECPWQSFFCCNAMRVKTFLIRYKQTQAEVIREFVERVEVFQPARVGGRKVQRLRIVWNCIGEFTPPQP